MGRVVVSGGPDDAGLDVAAAVDRILSLAEHLAERSGGQTRLLPVTKALPLAAVEAVRLAGLSEVGENYAQELLAKAAAVEEATGEAGADVLDWHFIGRLQRNKVRRLAGVVALWQTIDRRELLDEVARRDPGARVLVQVDAVGLPGRGGCPVDEVEDLVAHGVDLGLDVRGLMTVGAPGDEDATGRVFRTVAGLADRLSLPEVSMGMTDDLGLAVDCGSTLVRVGRALFGERPVP
ncbi:MAG: alanine racemase [Acidimicrobiales bacterium]|nr:alanine racemase [Acidimicrobiales bacterium]